MGDAEHPEYSRSEMVSMMREAAGPEIFVRGFLFGLAFGLFVAAALTLTAYRAFCA